MVSPNTHPTISNNIISLRINIIQELVVLSYYPLEIYKSGGNFPWLIDPITKALNHIPGIVAAP